jgi:hypothetical protein
MAHRVRFAKQPATTVMIERPNRPERPRLEPEIIPPRRGDPHAGHEEAWPYTSGTARTTHRIYITRLGPFGFALLMLIIGIVAAVILLATIGAVLLWIPVLALLLAIGAILRLWRR